MDTITQAGIIAIIRGVETIRIVETVQALIDGGIRFIEITFDQSSPAAAEETVRSLRKVREVFGNRVSMGAGTVLTIEQVRAARDCGAEYIISPNVNTEVIGLTKELGMLSLPGALTPTEITAAYAAGADGVKLFPAGSLGVGYIKSLMGPLGHIPLFAVGGVGLENLEAFFAAGVKGIGIGGKLVDRSAIREGNYPKLTEVARQYVQRVQCLAPAPLQEDKA